MRVGELSHSHRFFQFLVPLRQRALSSVFCLKTRQKIRGKRAQKDKKSQRPVIFRGSREVSDQKDSSTTTTGTPTLRRITLACLSHFLSDCGGAKRRRESLKMALFSTPALSLTSLSYPTANFVAVGAFRPRLGVKKNTKFERRCAIREKARPPGSARLCYRYSLTVSYPGAVECE